MIDMVTVWTQLAGSDEPCSEPITIADPWHDDAVRMTIVPLGPRDGVIAAALVPDDQAGRTAINGVPVAAGLALLRHGDRIVAGDSTRWVSVASVVEVTPYDAETHGQDARCFITKSRLAPGEPIVVCPGSGGVACDAIYRESAWQQLTSDPSHRFRCARCGFDPRAAQWRPPLRHRPTTLNQLLALMGEPQ